jgi:hypothetical protein
MFEQLRPLTFGFALLTSVVVSSGCDQVRNLTDRFTNSGKANKTPAPAAKPAKSNEPVLQPMKKDWMPPGVRKR